MIKKQLLIAASSLVLAISSHADETDKKVSAGIGFGIPYGGLGANIAYQVTSFWDITAGLGASIYAPGAGWSFGSRIYPSSTSKFRLSGLYGVNRGIETTDCYYSCESEQEQFSGLVLGLGWGARAGEKGWDIDLLYIATSGNFDKRVDELQSQGYELENDASDITISFGYHWDL